MPRLLSSRDFRARRVVLTRGDFGYAPKTESRPTDVIDRHTWNSIVILPDDVAIRTSNHHGTALRQLDALGGAWVEAIGEEQDYMFPVMLDAADDFQAATYLVLTGYYRLSLSALRSAIELVSIGAWAQVCGRDAEFRNWRAQKIPLSFGQSCDGLRSATSNLGKHLRATVNDSLFDPRTSSTEGGFARRLYSGVSEFAHARPGHTDSDLRKSNGPIYVRSVFKRVAWMQFETFALCTVLVGLARPKVSFGQAIVRLFSDPRRVKSRVTRAAFLFLKEART